MARSPSAVVLRRRLERLAKQAANLRDQFREIEEEAKELADNFDPSMNGLSDALHALGSSTDTMSRLV